MGRKSKLTKENTEKALDYIENYSDYDHAIPSIVGLAVVLNVAKSTIYDWAKVDGSQFPYILEKCNAAQEFTLINKGLRSEVNPTIAKLVLGKHGYSENIKNENTGANGGPIQNDWKVTFINATPEKKETT